MSADAIGFSDLGALVGETVGNYRITDLLGQGGMGVVYRAEHVLLGKRAAVKVLLPERCSSREIVDRFFNEAKASTLIEDPGIVDIFDFGRLPDGNAYIVMELLEGETLGERLKRLERIPATHAASIARHIAGTLAAAHAHGIIHRDLKPDNVFLVRDSALPRGERAKLLDFGIAKLQQQGTQPSDLVKTETGRLMGTPYYMSPEQCRGAGKIDQRTDIYSLGCVLYQMLTGRPPFVMEGAGEILAAHIHVPPLPPRTHEPSVPPALEMVVLRLLEKDPARRYQSAADVVEALNRAALRFSGEEDAPEPSLQDSSKHRPRSGASATTAPFTEATTINSTAGELGLAPGHGRLRRIWPWLVGAATAATAGALVTMAIASQLDDGPAPRAAAATRADAGAQSAPATAPTTTPVATPAPTAPSQDPIVRELETAPAEETVRLWLNSRPSGATVYRESDGVRLGKTPLEVRARRGRGDAVFILRRNGYRTELVTMPVDEDQRRVVALRRGPTTPSPLVGEPAGPTDPPTATDPPEREPPEREPPEREPDQDPPDREPPAEDKDDEPSQRADESKDEPVRTRGKDDALDPFNLLRPAREKKGGKDEPRGKDDGKGEPKSGEVSPAPPKSEPGRN
jgi:serine/threonine protein kinase